MARPGLSACFISLNLLRHGRQDDKLTASTASWEGCKLQASEVQLWSNEGEWLVKKYRMIWLFAETIFSVKTAEAVL